MVEKYMRQADIARRFGVTTRTVSSWIADPKSGLPRPVVIGRKNYFDPAEIAAWEADRKMKVGEAA